MSVEMLTYAALGARLKISPQAARSLIQAAQVAVLSFGCWQSACEC